MSIIVYHGSKAKFQKFDLSKIRSQNGTTEGVGLYFTTNKSIASHYAEPNGYLYTVEFDGKKPLDHERLSITRPVLRKLLKAIEDAGIPFLSNYGEVEYEGYETVMDEALDNLLSNENDIDLIGEIYNTEGNKSKILELAYQVLGFDYFTLVPDWAVGKQVLYVALVPNILTIKTVELVKE